MSDSPNPSHVDHPLWSRFLRWCTIRPKQPGTYASSGDPATLSPKGMWLESLNDYEYVPLPDPQSYIRLATLLPGEFDDDITVEIYHHVLRPPSGRRNKRLALVDIRKDLPSG